MYQCRKEWLEKWHTAQTVLFFCVLEKVLGVIRLMSCNLAKWCYTSMLFNKKSSVKKRLKSNVLNAL